MDKKDEQSISSSVNDDNGSWDISSDKEDVDGEKEIKE